MSRLGPYFFFDFDSTLVTKESFDMVIEQALSESPEKEDLVAKVEAITSAGMGGNIPFTASLEERFAVVPLTLEYFEMVGEKLKENITPGIKELFTELREKQVSTYIISGGFRESIMPVAEVLGVSEDKVFTNTLILDEDGKVKSIDSENVCYTNDGKAPVIEHIKEVHQLTGKTFMIGDGANDLKAYELGVVDGFCGFTANVERDIIKKSSCPKASTLEELRDFLFNPPD